WHVAGVGRHEGVLDRVTGNHTLDRVGRLHQLDAGVVIAHLDRLLVGRVGPADVDPGGVGVVHALTGSGREAEVVPPLVGAVLTLAVGRRRRQGHRGPGVGLVVDDVDGPVDLLSVEGDVGGRAGRAGGIPVRPGDGDGVHTLVRGGPVLVERADVAQGEGLTGADGDRLAVPDRAAHPVDVDLVGDVEGELGEVVRVGDGDRAHHRPAGVDVPLLVGGHRVLEGRGTGAVVDHRPGTVHLLGDVPQVGAVVLRLDGLAHQHPGIPAGRDLGRGLLRGLLDPGGVGVVDALAGGHARL